MSAESKMSTLASARERAVKDTPARERLALLFDEGSFTELDAFANAQGGSAGVVTGYGSVEGATVFAFAQDITEANGAVGRLQAAKIKKIYDLAVKTGAPVVGIYDSYGAALREGNDALAAYGEMMQWGNALSGVVPQIAVIAGTCAGSAAMMACSADLVVMSKEAEFFLTAPSIEKAKGAGADGAGSAQNAALAGVAHLVKKDAAEAIAAAKRLLSMLPQNNLAPLPIFDFTAPENADTKLRGACENGELEAAALVESIFDAGSVVELMPEYGPKGSYIALATLGGFSCGIAAAKGGRALCAKNCKKLAMLMQLCDAFQIPVVTLVDASGFKPDAQAELAGLAKSAAALAHVYAEATTAKIALVTGKAYGPAYIALAGKNANADVVLAWPSASISALAPETAVAVLHADEITAQKDLNAWAAEYAANEASPYKAAQDGYVDDVIDPADTRSVLISTLDMLSGKRVSRLPKKHSNLPL